jgi:uncharacterized membrane protein
MSERLPGSAPVGRRVRLRLRPARRSAPVEVVADPEPGTPVQRASATVGAAFVLVGLLGFLPGITVHFDGLTMIGHQSTALLLGVFSVSMVHNAIHLLFGITGIALARKPLLARGFLLAGGIVYLVLALVGWLHLVDELPVNPPDNWLHTALGAVMIALAMLRRR